MNLEQNESRRRFAAERVAQLGTADAAGQPHIVPVTFALDGDEVFIAIDWKPKRSRNLKRLRNIAENPRVSILADRYADDWSQLWWVRGDGEARILDTDADMHRPLEFLKSRYPQYAERPPEGPVIAISVKHWSGWSLA